jgi:DNA-binding GntR family transcriptional regulator
MAQTLLNLKSLKEQVYDYLREQLRFGALKPGSLINTEETAAKLGVSRTPLRDALIQLAMEDFVSIIPRQGVVVRPLTLRDIEEYYQIIGALESIAVLLSFEKIDPAGITEMRGYIAEMKRALEDDDFDRYYRMNLRFHNTYLQACRNHKLVQIVNTLKSRLYDFPRKREFVKEWELRSMREHERFVELLAEGRAREAAEYVRDVHWSYSVQKPYIRQYYGSAPEE